MISSFPKMHNFCNNANIYIGIIGFTAWKQKIQLQNVTPSEYWTPGPLIPRPTQKQVQSKDQSRNTYCNEKIKLPTVGSELTIDHHWFRSLMLIRCQICTKMSEMSDLCYLRKPRSTLVGWSEDTTRWCLEKIGVVTDAAWKKLLQPIATDFTNVFLWLPVSNTTSY